MTYDWKNSKPPEKPFKVRVDSAGRILLPAELRKQLGVEPGRVLMMRMTKPGLMEVWTSEYAYRKARDILGEWKPGEPSVVDALIAERRAEAAKEDEEVQEWKRQRVLREKKSDG